MKSEKSVSDARVDTHHGHRDVTGGAQRATVFGISDGLVTNMSLILGVAGAHVSANAVRLAGFAGLIAGACSMAIGEYVSMKAQGELLAREIEIEAEELRRHPQEELAELARAYEGKGLSRELAEEVASALMQHPKTALEVHAMEELGITADSIGSPIHAAVASFISFSVGAFLPLIAWLFTSGMVGIVYSAVISIVAALAVGLLLAYFTGRPYVRTAMRQVILSGAAAGITYLIGYLLGSSGMA